MLWSVHLLHNTVYWSVYSLISPWYRSKTDETGWGVDWGRAMPRVSSSSGKNTYTAYGRRLDNVGKSWLASIHRCLDAECNEVLNFPVVRAWRILRKVTTAYGETLKFLIKLHCEFLTYSWFPDSWQSSWVHSLPAGDYEEAVSLICHVTFRMICVQFWLPLSLFWFTK